MALSLLDDSGPSADTCFDALALSLLLSRSLSVNVHTKRLPLMSTHRLLVTWYLRNQQLLTKTLRRIELASTGHILRGYVAIIMNRLHITY